MIMSNVYNNTVFIHWRCNRCSIGPYNSIYRLITTYFKHPADNHYLSVYCFNKILSGPISLTVTSGAVIHHTQRLTLSIQSINGHYEALKKRNTLCRSPGEDSERWRYLSTGWSSGAPSTAKEEEYQSSRPGYCLCYIGKM